MDKNKGTLPNDAYLYDLFFYNIRIEVIEQQWETSLVIPETRLTKTSILPN